MRHRPEKGFSLQLNHPARLAERTGIDVLCDFRARDIAAGGQGAPLVPAFHRAVFAGEEDRAVLNVGGIANVTILTKEKTEGFDTGPGNMLLDAWCQREKGEAFDRDGAFARKGRLLPELLDELLSDPYFTLPPPKSTGRETFHLGWLTKRLGARRYAPEDVARTLTVLTARTATDAIRRWAPGVSTEPQKRLRGAAGHPETFSNGFVFRQTLKDEPQPQVVTALGLSITNCSPERPSLKSIFAPTRY